MGLTKLPVATKLDAELVGEIDALVARFWPVVEDRSSMVRILLRVAVTAINNGTLPDTLSGLQAVLRKPPVSRP